MKNSKFRQFVNQMYMTHKDECKWWKVACKYQSLDHYAAKNKYFLKRKYKEENQNGN